MANNARVLGLIVGVLAVIGLVACDSAAPQTVDTVPTLSDSASPEAIEATRVVSEVVEATQVAPEIPLQAKNLVVCMTQEPDTLYPYDTTMLASRAVQHALFENSYTTLAFDYQAQALEKLPSLADGDAVLNIVEVNAGDLVLTANDEPKELATGDVIINAQGEEVTFSGSPVAMEQMVVDFTMKPTVFADGTPVKASDSVYSFKLAADPDTPWPKTVTHRTAGYETTGDLTTRWTGLPGYKDSTYFLNFWAPYPEHLWGGYSAAELLSAEEVSRLPVGDGPFRIVEWVPGDSIRLVKNEFYYRAEEGLPYLDSVTFQFVPNTNQLLAQLLSGQCDIGTQDGLSPNEASFLIEAEDSNLLIPHFQTGTVYEHMDFNIDPYGDYAATRYDWFEDVRVRQALAMCTDRQGMVDNILFGQSEVIHSYVPAVHPLYPAGELTEWSYDVDAANALLDEAGFDRRDADGFRLDPGGARFAPQAQTTTGNAMREQIMQIFKANLAQCGVDVQIDFLPGSEWFADGPEGPLFGRRYDLGEFAWLTGVEPACYLYQSNQVPGPAGEVNPKTGLNYNGWGGQNNTGYVNPAYDSACIRATQALPGTPEYEAGHQEAQIIFSQELPVIPLFLRIKVAATRPGVLNFSLDSTQPSEMYNLYEIDLEE